MASKFLDRLLEPLRRTVPPTKAGGVGGTAFYGGYIQETERNPALVGQEKYRTYADILANVSIVAASVRYFLNLTAKAGWTIEPAEVKGETSKKAEELAELVDTILNDMSTPWPRVVRRTAMFKFHGFSIQEWTAKRRKDGTLGLLDIETRPQVTIERWDVDRTGTVVGVIQRSPQDGEELYLPRRKLVYAVDDSLKDSPEGLGIFRHLAEPSHRLKVFQLLESYGYETDLRGIPVARGPLGLLQQQVSAEQMTDADRSAALNPLKAFIKDHVRNPEMGLLLDSMTYTTNDDAQSPSGVKQWDIELLRGDGAASSQAVATTIERVNRELARIMGTEFLMLGGDGRGSMALSKDKTAQFALVVDSTLTEMAQTYTADIIKPLFELNGWDEELVPKMKPEAIKFTDIESLTGALSALAQAGSPLPPEDPAVDVVRDLLGLPKQDKALMSQQAQDAALLPPMPPGGKPPPGKGGLQPTQAPPPPAGAGGGPGLPKTAEEKAGPEGIQKHKAGNSVSGSEPSHNSSGGSPSTPQKHKRTILTSQKVLDKVIDQTEGRPQTEKLSREIKKEAYYEEVDVPLSEIASHEGVDPTRAIVSKGAVVLNRQRGIIDGRHRVALARQQKASTIRALIPVDPPGVQKHKAGNSVSGSEPSHNAGSWPGGNKFKDPEHAEVYDSAVQNIHDTLVEAKNGAYTIKELESLESVCRSNIAMGLDGAGIWSKEAEDVLTARAEWSAQEDWGRFTAAAGGGKRMRLSSAQISAMETRDWSEEPMVRAGWDGSHLTVPSDETARTDLWRELNEASNVEDADETTDPVMRGFSQRASRSLAAVASKVIRSGPGAVQKHRRPGFQPKRGRGTYKTPDIKNTLTIHNKDGSKEVHEFNSIAESEAHIKGLQDKWKRGQWDRDKVDSIQIRQPHGRSSHYPSRWKGTQDEGGA